MRDKNASVGTFRVVGIGELDAGMIARRIGSGHEFRVDEVERPTATGPQFWTIKWSSLDGRGGGREGYTGLEKFEVVQERIICSPDGATVDLIASIIAAARTLKGRPLDAPEVKEALADLAGDNELGQLIRTGRIYRIQRGL